MPYRHDWDWCNNPNRELRESRTELATAVQETFGRRCPCCNNPMVQPRRRNPTSMGRRDRPTVAHNMAVAAGGNPAVWCWACLGCNQDQGPHSFRDWAFRLDRQGDRRAGSVFRLSDFVEDWCAVNDVPQRLPRRADTDDTEGSGR